MSEIETGSGRRGITDGHRDALQKMASPYGPETTTKNNAAIPENRHDKIHCGQWVKKPSDQRGIARWKRLWRGITKWKGPQAGEHNKQWRTETARGERDARGRNAIGSSGFFSGSGVYGNARTAGHDDNAPALCGGNVPARDDGPTAWFGGHEPTCGGTTTAYYGGNVPTYDNGSTAWCDGHRPAYDGTTTACHGGNVPACNNGPTAWFGGHKPAYGGKPTAWHDSSAPAYDGAPEAIFDGNAPTYDGANMACFGRDAPAHVGGPTEFFCSDALAYEGQHATYFDDYEPTCGSAPTTHFDGSMPAYSSGGQFPRVPWQPAACDTPQDPAAMLICPHYMQQAAINIQNGTMHHTGATRFATNVEGPMQMWNPQEEWQQDLRCM